jgi:hypothetical protein
MAARVKKKNAKPKPPSRGHVPPEVGNSPAPGQVELRIPGAKFALRADASSRLAFYWSYVVRSRGRWQSDPDLRTKLVDQATARFAELGLGPNELDRIARAGIVEVATPYDDSGLWWAPRILPWEFLLTEATRNQRNSPLCVVRHLWSNHPRKKPTAPKKFLFVENAAGAIGNYYSFSDERAWMQSQLTLATDKLINPTQDVLSAKIARYQPDIIHLSGVDWRQGASLGLIDEPPSELDGLLMAGRGSSLRVIDQNELADCLNPPDYRGARLVVLNLYNSAARLAAAAVAQGAHAAIGFQDEISDDVAEQFLASFYRHWQDARWDLMRGFRATLNALGHSVSLSGTGVVLWSGTSLIPAGGAAISAPLMVSRSKPKSASPRDLVGVRVAAPTMINYSLLHSGERLFGSFTIYRRATGVIPPIQVEVILRAGTDSFPYNATVQMGDGDQSLQLATSIHLPLTSRALRALKETVRTGLYVRVTCNNIELACETYEVKLCPIDEWRWDSEDDARWLAAFVLPRDPAVLRIIDLAQKYLLALQDDSSAGFDGYQSVDETLDDPEIGVEMQVRAIWSALAFELPISYVNPPPVFTEESQRLRSPSEVLNGKRGTCIDLALMLAACLEYIEIYPVVFVLKDHAFPGFWRSESAYASYLSFEVADEPLSSTPDTASDGTDTPTARQFTDYEDTLRHVRAGRLVPLETVYLTRRLSFREAIEQGMENLKDRGNFGKLLDLRRERKAITPLPVLTGDA